MKGREAKAAAPSADLLVCFPSRLHLTLMPKPICSPARPSESNNRHRRHHPHHHHHHHHHLKKATSKGAAGGGGGGQASPLLWTKPKSMGPDISEPTSPKVTCAGQIKVRPKPNSCKNWQSVMEEIERLHNNRKHKKRANWLEGIGFKKEVMQFLTCLRSIRFDFRCFGSIPTSDITSDDEEEDDDDEEEEDNCNYPRNQAATDASDGSETSRTLFSKWFLVLQENQSINGCSKEQNRVSQRSSKAEYSVDAPPCVPPSNALLLMRCRSAPAKSWLEEREEEQDDDNCDDRDDERETEEDNKDGLAEEEEEKKKSLVVMRYESGFHKCSSEIAKETWVSGGIRQLLSRSQSSRR